MDGYSCEMMMSNVVLEIILLYLNPRDMIAFFVQNGLCGDGGRGRRVCVDLSGCVLEGRDVRRIVEFFPGVVVRSVCLRSLCFGGLEFVGLTKVEKKIATWSDPFVHCTQD